MTTFLSLWRDHMKDYKTWEQVVHYLVGIAGWVFIIYMYWFESGLGTVVPRYAAY